MPILSLLFMKFLKVLYSNYIPKVGKVYNFEAVGDHCYFIVKNRGFNIEYIPPIAKIFINPLRIKNDTVKIIRIH